MKRAMIHKLAIRQDDRAGLLRAYFSSVDDTDRFEVATLNLALARKVPELFGAWKDALANAHRVAVEEATGLKVAGQTETWLHEKN